MENQNNQTDQPSAEEIMSKLSSIPEDKIVENAKVKAKEMLSDSEKILAEYLELSVEEFALDEYAFVSKITLLRLKEITQSIPTENPGGLDFLTPIISFWNTVKTEIENYHK